VGGLTGIVASALLDRVFYGFWTLPFLGLVHFNVIENKAALYGTHPWHWYLTSGLPAVAGILLVVATVQVLEGLLRCRSRRCRIQERNGSGAAAGHPPSVVNIDEARSRLWILVASYIGVMSMNQHKEFRYIHPVLPLLCILTGPGLRDLVLGRRLQQHGSKRLGGGWSPRGIFGMAVVVVANVIPVLYLGLFHQTGPVAVHQDIVQVARMAAAADLGIQRPLQARMDDNKTFRFSVQYYTGECHSAPLHSHLHSPPLVFATRTLDCSPSCRSDPLTKCETQHFQEDPMRFVRDDLAFKLVPDFVVTVTSYVARLDPLLQEMGLEEVGRYPHHVRGVSVRRRMPLQPREVHLHYHQHQRSLCWGWGDGCRDDNMSSSSDRAANHAIRRIHFALPFIHWDLEIPMEDVVLFSLYNSPSDFHKKKKDGGRDDCPAAGSSGSGFCG
jgi:phosphatidylinositol glycan class B